MTVVQPAPTTHGSYTAVEVAEHRRRWVEALRSDRFTQGFKALRTSRGVDDQRPDAPPTSEFCCLGVAECVRGATWRWQPRRSDTPLENFDLAGLWRVVEPELGDGAVVTTSLSEAGARWLGLVELDPLVVLYDEAVDRWRIEALSALNDDGPNVNVDAKPASTLEGAPGHWTFAQIADVIEAQPPDWDGSRDLTQRRALALNAARRNAEVTSS